MSKILIAISFLFSAGCASAATTGATLNTTAGTATTGAEYRARYPLADATTKLVDNQGRGPSSLYGTRNFRAVLNGVYYRGGGNNVHLSPVPRKNSNPLPDVGLEDLCKEGFGHAVYLYPTNFESAPHEVRCRDFHGNDRVLSYVQISPLDYRDADLRELHKLIYEHVRDPRLGPIYDHCWNGWHASGYVAATTLRQFCGFTAEQAVAYWNKNTDGNDDASYEGIRKRLRAFVPAPGLGLTAKERAALCPDPATLKFSAARE